MAILYDTEQTLRQRVAKCLEDDFKHNAIETAQETFFNKRAEVVDSWPGFEDMREVAKRMRQNVTDNLDYYVSQFAENAESHGVIMHYAPTELEALWEILDVFESHGAACAVKSKSMMTEEMGLNEVLEEAGVNVIETDCAENILQTAQDRPSHIVVPALHLDRDAIADIYKRERGYEGDSVPEHITHFLRKILREEFLKAEVGIRGCNFAVAETGSVTLVTNEGNGRMVDTCPPVQIVVIGIDRLVPTLEDLDASMALLPRSAVGAQMTAYFSVDTGARAEGEVDGPQEVHYVIMDNGRSDMIGTEFESMLRCCRCGACLNICPVYRHITGHGYGSIYPGPMGIVLTAVLEGYKEIDTLAYACTLCGACTDRCPVKIPLHELIRQHRMNMIDEGLGHLWERPLMAAASMMWTNVGIYRAAMKAGRPVMKAMSGENGTLDAGTAWIPILKGWTGFRDVDLLSEGRFRDWFAEHKAELAAQQAAAAEAETDEAADGGPDVASAASAEDAASKEAPAAQETPEEEGASA